MKAIITFLLIFCVIVVFHEFGHFFFAKRSGILVREFAIGMGPKIFAHTGKDGTVYTIRILPLGGYVRMAGWGEDTTEIKTGSPASLTLGKDGKVRRINLSDRQVDQTALPMNVTAYDLEDKLTITGLRPRPMRLTMMPLSLRKTVRSFVLLLRMSNIKMLAFGDV